MTLALPAPFGWPDGTHISMRARHPVDGKIVAGLVLGWGCPPFILPRVASAMSASGRYDCLVTVSEQALRNLEHHLDRIGVDLIIDPKGKRRPFFETDYR